MRARYREVMVAQASKSLAARGARYIRDLWSLGRIYGRQQTQLRLLGPWRRRSSSSTRVIDTSSLRVVETIRIGAVVGTPFLHKKERQATCGTRINTRTSASIGRT